MLIEVWLIVDSAHRGVAYSDGAYRSVAYSGQCLLLLLLDFREEECSQLNGLKTHLLG